MADRSDLLKTMYEQMFRDIAQQYTVVWQSAGTVFASFAIIALSEKDIIPIDLAISIIILICTWFILNVIECSYWYNRNLCIIANIERQFLNQDDLKDIHYYFGSHRPKNKMISHLQNQAFLGWGVFFTLLLYHLLTRVVTGFNLPFSAFDPIRGAPYAIAVACGIYIFNRDKKRQEAYAEFLRESPGKEIDSSNVNYGIGHGHTN